LGIGGPDQAPALLKDRADTVNGDDLADRQRDRFRTGIQVAYAVNDLELEAVGAVEADLGGIEGLRQVGDETAQGCLRFLL